MDDVVAKLKRRLVSGQRLHEAGKDLGLSRRQTQRIAKDYDLHQYIKRGAPRRWTEEDFEFAESLLRDGASFREAERTTKVSRQVLMDRFPELGWSREEGLEFGRAVQRFGGMVK